MYEIRIKEDLTPVTKLFEVHAPAVARKAQAGQFVIVRVDEKGERIPLTVADYDRDRGTVTLVVQEVGKTTMQMGTMQVDDCSVSRIFQKKSQRCRRILKLLFRKPLRH